MKRKVGHLRCKLREGRVVKKQKTKRNTVADDMDPGVDRISELPEPLIHQILANQHTKDVFRTTILSNRWKSMFDSFPVFDFDERYFQIRGVWGKHNRMKAREVRKKKFNRYVEKSLVSRLWPFHSIDKFRLSVRTLDEVQRNRMGQWLQAALDKKVKELEIHVAKKKNYNLPDVVLSSTTITSLKLSACAITDTAIIKLCNLRILSVKNIHITESRIGEVVKSCRLLEDLRLVNCKIPRFSIPNHRELRRVELHSCKDLNYIGIDAPNLETFWYRAKRNQQCRILLKGCSNLKHLLLQTDMAHFNSSYPLLETMELQRCRYLQGLRIQSTKLKSLAIIECEKLQEIKVDVPNPYSFQHNGDVNVLPSMNVLNLHEAKLYSSEKRTSPFFAQNKNFFENFDASKGFKLITYSWKDIKIYEEPAHAHLSDDSFYKVVVTASPTDVLRTVDKWLWEAHGCSLKILCPRSDTLWKSICAMIENREENPECCKFCSNKCWRHYLDGVRIVDFSMEFTWRSRKKQRS